MPGTVLFLPGRRRSALARDLPGTGSKTGACGVSDIIESADFAAASRQIAGKVERHPGRSYGLRPESTAKNPPQDRSRPSARIKISALYL